ncbi:MULTISPECIES: hypothetical protein [unclassified Dehalobacter]|jgi:hypothetical protein|uniref:hypothetical protein n=1 Tax=unclassified Dehalobacter TaxID=2635733 RepID=UPI0003006E69
MARKVKKKKSGIRIFVTFPLIIVIAALAYKSIITPGNHQIFEKGAVSQLSPNEGRQ